MTFEEKVDKFVDKLASISSTDKFYNMYEKQECIKNLKIYLKAMKKSRIMLVGEAPGRDGCAITGVPFTSEAILKKNVVPGRNYYVKEQQTEPTATMMWEFLGKLPKSKLPLLWNSFPFHPFKNDGKKSNRAPNDVEKRIGEKFIFDLIDIFQPKKIYAIGQHAFDLLSKMQLGYMFDANKEESYIRHPSNGGKTECHIKLEKIFNLE